MNHYVQIVEHETGNVVETMGPMTKSKAETVERGVDINLNHENYFSRITTHQKLKQTKK